ncbi:MAG: hypothetical protein WC667_07040 [Sulfurimonas sp.]|jgi:hypothetical protein
MNYKKSLLSLVTIIALGNMAAADDGATYLPLASPTVDSVWNLFGVNGFSNGTPSTGVVTSSGFSAGYTTLTDNIPTDENVTEGLTSTTGTPTGYLGSLQGIANSTPAIGTLSVGVNIAGVRFDPIEPVRSMYMKVGSTSVPNVKFNYKSSLEGNAIEILLNGALYSATISQDSTWANALTAVTGATPVIGSSNQIKTISGVLDFNSTNNPVDPRFYNATVHQDTTGETASFYHFNALTQQWEVNQRGAPTAAQDFTSFTAGKAYWGRADRVDSLGALTIDTDGPVNLVLGQATAPSGIPDPAMYVDESSNSTLTAGWNMLSFDDHKPFIRHAATGLITSGWAAGDTVTLTDDSGLNSLSIVLGVAADANSTVRINRNIESAKLLGKLPQTFNIKALYGGATGNFIFVSDRKFTVSGTAVAVIPTTTLTGAKPYVSGTRTTVADAEATPATSAYGEYTTLTEVLTGATSTSSLITAGAKLKFTASNATGGAQTVNIITSLATAETNIEAIGATVHPVATQVDTNNDDVADKLIIANLTPFSLQDATYTRVFADDNSSASNVGNVTVSGAKTATVASNTGAVNTITTLSANINAANAGATATEVNATVTTDATPKLVVATNSISTFDVKDVASGTIDILSASSTATDLAKGAVGGVYSLDSLARLPVDQYTQKITTITTVAAGYMNDLDANATYVVTINGVAQTAVDFNSSIAGGVPGVTDNINTYGEFISLLDRIVLSINTYAKTAGKHISGSHSYTIPTGSVAADTLPAAVTPYTVDLAITGADVNTSAFSLAIIDGNSDLTVPTITGAVQSGDNNITLGSGDLVADLKTNPAYSPNFAIFGPLYTLRNAGTGYDVRAILKATTELDAITSTTSSTIVWDSIDITRNEDEWFLNNEFNLFNINHNAGYWVYLENKTPDVVSIVSATFTSPSYSYYFSNDSIHTPKLATTNIMSSGQISVTITGLDDAVAGSAYITVAGEEVPLKRVSTSNTFTADVSNYALTSFSQNQSGPIAIGVRAVNGKGQAVSANSTLSIDYAAPENVTATVSGGTDLALGATGTTANFYVFKNYIPEVESARGAAIIKTVPATGNAATLNACAEFTYGDMNTLRIVAADGAMNSSNLSDAKEVIFASLLKSANVITHTQGVGLKSQLGAVYDNNCTNTATQTLATENAGVSLATLPSGATTRISFQPIANANFTQDVARTANYKVDATTVAQIQSVVSYATKKFFLEYNGSIYEGSFPATQIAADASIMTPIALTKITAANTSLLP